MFRRGKNLAEESSVDVQQPQNAARAKSESVETPVAPRYPKPKVLLLDLKDDSDAVLRTAGYNVHVGTLGTPYSVPKSNSYQVVPRDYKIPNYAEQEIVIVDLAPNKRLKQATEDVETIEGNYDYWAKCNDGMVDPRAIASKLFRSSFDTIHAHGGVFVVFANYQVGTDIIYARKTSRGLESSNGDFELWSFLTTLRPDRFQVEFLQGKEIQGVDTSTPLGKLVTRHLSEAQFTCHFGPRQYIGNSSLYNYNKDFRTWLTLATDKYGFPVAGAFTPHDDVKGFVFILPQLARKSQFLVELLRDLLPDFAPGLFPYAEGKQWIDRDEYQVPQVIELRRQISAVEAEANERVRDLEHEIGHLKEQTGYLRQLLTETGDALVKAVKTTLEQLGFASVIDVDEEMKNSDPNGTKREDLRIIEDPMTLLIEVKGITGLPTDADALQVNKYVVVRMKEWKHTNVQGLEIINHQRGVPPLGREHEKTFRDDILVNAEEQHFGFGLMTSWDLFRLTRSFLKLNWKFEQIKPLFFSVGRIEPVPVHYEFLGVVEHFWERVGAVGVRLESAQITEGDRIAFQLPIEYEEQVIDSLQVDNEQVKVAHASALVGIKTGLSRQQLRNGTRVYRVNPTDANQRYNASLAQSDAGSPT